MSYAELAELDGALVALRHAQSLLVGTAELTLCTEIRKKSGYSVPNWVRVLVALPPLNSESTRHTAQARTWAA